MSEDRDQSALDYHRYPKPGKLEIKATKPLANQRDLALAYSPGVAAACREIEQDALAASHYTARGNLVAVISNGTAVLGLGAIGALASKPVMEGKAVLFKQFADIDVFDIEIDERDPEAFIETVARLEPTFGGINLEDIKAPDCFIIERGLKERMGIPVFHDDQHGTAIVVSAAILNALRVVGKDISRVRLVTAGAGAAALACVDLLVALGLPKENVTLTDIAGVVYQGRVEEMDPYKGRYAIATDLRTLEQAIAGADIFLGLSAAGVLKPEWLARMAEAPIIMALANPVPEIMPDLARAARPDAIIATGRSDFPNQVNNVLCFPFIFRGALDCGATEINEAMKVACVRAIADLALAEPSDIVRAAYGGQQLQFGPEYLIPKPFDPRLMEHLAPAVARAAMDSGVATRPIADLDAYRQSLRHRAYRTGLTMKPVFDQARAAPKRVVFAEGEDERVLQVAQQAVSEGIARPMLIGRPEVIEARIEALGLRLRPERDFDLVVPGDNPRIETHWRTFYDQVKRRGYAPDEAREYIRNDPTVLAATLVRCGDADALLCGLVGRYSRHLKHVEEAIGTAPGVRRMTAMNAVVLPAGPLFIADTYVQIDPSAEDLAEITRLCAAEIRCFGLTPRVAFVSHSNFGSDDSPSAAKMTEALRLLREQEPELEVEGEMHANLAFDAIGRQARFPDSRLTGRANLLIMPNQDAANIAFNLLRTLDDAAAFGPMLLGTAQAAHIVTPSATVRGLLNMTALAVVQAG
ncbi:NADP-dependent malic enzyme [Allochromatium humboldtianum]|uniref:NADP-dependent malic enzyme n=1 Tax=Allochromatium humboldtianum TaxID=504901 RepID=A0A850RAV6_9GAMM|nr:NADP-dependent malic enzyme [Allochromatium humboldtianum]NVZ08412.1 NADP-dependent malic enzyme [Allochromatium humboldtianum]